MAATATLQDGQRKNLLPAYVHRTEGEVLLAEAAIQEGSLDDALGLLEEMIDGTPGKIAAVNEFWSLKPASASYSDIIGHFYLFNLRVRLQERVSQMI